MNIFLCANAFKGTLTAKQANDAFREGLSFFGNRATFFSFPLADGGDGTLECLLEARKADFEVVETSVHCLATDSLDKSRYLLDRSGKKAYIALYETSGLAKTKERIPERRTTLGFGEQIWDALDKGVRDFSLFIGGSSTTDLGCGMLTALGAVFRDEDGRSFLPTGLRMEDVQGLSLDNLDKRIGQSVFTLYSDVESLLLGPRGAVMVFSAQKGTRKEDQERLERAASVLADLMERKAGRECRDLQGAGAAGGVGFACLLFLHAVQKSGASALLDLMGLSGRMKDADLAVLGEGRIDSSSLDGKILGETARLCHRFHLPFVTVSGSIELESERRLSDLGGLRFLLSGSPSSQKEANEDKIISSLRKEEAWFESFYEKKFQGGQRHG